MTLGGQDRGEKLVEQVLDHVGQRSVPPKHQERLVAATGRKHLERSNQAGPEPGGVAVALVQREPRRGDGGFLHPARQQQRLARPSRGDHDRERSGDNVIQQLEEALPADVVLGSAGRPQLCSQQRGRLFW